MAASAAGEAGGEGGAAGGGRPAGVEAAAAAAHVVIEVADVCTAEQRQQQAARCRICHLADGELPDCGAGGRLVRLGCGCRGELAAAHRRCAEAWFSVRGNRRCEICGENAVNVTCRGGGVVGGAEFMRQWHGTAAADAASGLCRTQSVCNLLVACVILVVVLLWFFHYHII